MQKKTFSGFLPEKKEKINLSETIKTERFFSQTDTRNYGGRNTLKKPNDFAYYGKYIILYKLIQEG